MSACGARAQAAAVVRLEGGGQADAETLGPAVWAADAAGVFWPGEALDPFRLPRTRALPAGAAAGASARPPGWWPAAHS
jgi:hypothetical protein